MNSVVATATAGMPRFSQRMVSCKLHVVHDPQSAKPSTTASIGRNSSITGSGAFLEKVGFLVRTISVARYCSRRIFSRRSRKKLPPGLLMSSKPIFFPARLLRRGGGEEAFTTLSFIGLINVVGIDFYSKAVAKTAIIAKISKI